MIPSSRLISGSCLGSLRHSSTVLARGGPSVGRSIGARAPNSEMTKGSGGGAREDQDEPEATEPMDRRDLLRPTREALAGWTAGERLKKDRMVAEADLGRGLGSVLVMGRVGSRSR